MLARILPGASQLQNYHPLLVHFPIAFIYGASLLYFLAWISASEKLQWTALWMLILAALSAAVALASGFYAAPGLMVSESVRNELLSSSQTPDGSRIDPNRRANTVGASITPNANESPHPIPGRPIALMALIAAGADLGGEMVYGYNAAGTACPQPIDFKK